MKQIYETMTKLKILDDNNVKHVSLFIPKINFLTLFGCGVKLTPDIYPIYTLMDRPCPNFFKNLFQSYTNRYWQYLLIGGKLKS